MDQQKEVLFTVGGMHCAACSSRLERVLNGMDGVQSATVSLAANSATVVPDPALSESDTEALVHQIEERAVDMGFTATPVAPEADMVDTWEAQQKETVGQLATLKARLWPEFGFTILLLLVSMGHMWGLPLPAIIDPMHSPESALNHALLQLVLTLPVLWSGRHFYLTGLPNLWRLTPNMDSLVAMGTGAAFLYSLWNTVEVALGHTGKVMDLYYESAAVLISLISLGKYLEAVSRFRMSDAIGALMNLTPETALRLPAPDKADQAEEVPVKVVRVGDYLQVKPGGRIPVDGVVTNGASSVDASMLTGESMPVPVGVGSSVAGGTMNTTGSFIMRAERVGADTALSRIIKLVREAQSSKAPIARFHAARHDRHAFRFKGAAGDGRADVADVVRAEGQPRQIRSAHAGFFVQDALTRLAGDEVDFPILFSPHGLKQRDAQDRAAGSAQSYDKTFFHGVILLAEALVCPVIQGCAPERFRRRRPARAEDASLRLR